MNYLDKTFSLSDKTAVITGGGGTLGGAIAQGLLSAGARVALWGRKLPALQAQKEALLKNTSAKATDLLCVSADMLQQSDIDRAIDESIGSLGRPDILINGAGGSSIRKPLIESDPQEFEETLRLNLVAGCYLPTRQFAAYWIREKIAGTVVNIASMASYNPLSEAWAYSAAKAAVMNQTMAQARELSAYGIRVNAIAPGFFLSNQNRMILNNPDGTPTARGERVLAHTPAGRFGRPEELQGAVVFLCSPGAGFVNGVTLPVDGGYLCSNI